MDLEEKVKTMCLAHENRIKTILGISIQSYLMQAARRKREFRKRLFKRFKSSSELFLDIHRKQYEIQLPEILQRRIPRIWMKPRNQDWWNHIKSSNDFDEWIDNFSVDKNVFDYLCAQLYDELKPNANCVREPLSVEQKVAVALYKLSTGLEYGIISDKFGVHKTSVHRCLKQFCGACIRVILPKEIKMPNLEKAEEMCKKFEQRTGGLPLILGAIDGCHIAIAPSQSSVNDYMNQKKWPSMVLQGVIDADLRFMNIIVKHPGCTSDEAILKESSLYKNINCFARPSKILNNKEIGAYVIGNQAFPLLNWLTKGYHEPMTPEEQSFNMYLNKAYIVVDKAFGRLKCRWRILQKRIEADISMAPAIIATCCALHNIAEEHKLPIQQKWFNSLQESNKNYPQPRSLNSLPDSIIPDDDIRDHMKDYMAQHFPMLP